MEEDYISSEYRTDDLQRGGYKICQKTGEFCFGIDSVLLADFAARKIKNNANVMDLCSGNGIIPILLHARNDTLQIIAVEIMPDAAKLASYNMKINKLENVNVICADAKSLAREMHGAFDAVTVNPPYIPAGEGAYSRNYAMSAAKHELHLTLDEMLHISSRLLKHKGSFFMVHRAHRSAEIFAKMSQYDLEPKIIRFVHPNQNEKANLILVYAVKGAGAWADIQAPLYIYDGGCYSDEIQEIYGRDV